MTNQLASLAKRDYFYHDPFWRVNLGRYIINKDMMMMMMGVMERALASNHCGPGSIPGPGVICGLSLLLVLSLLRDVFLWVLRFSPVLKNQHCQIAIQSGMHGHMLNELLSALKDGAY